MSTPPDSFASHDNNDDINQQEEVVTPPPTDAQSVETPQSTSPTSIADLPPEAQGEANGGPLGCCLGVMIGLVLSTSVALISRFYADPLAHLLTSGLSTIVRITMVIVAIIAVIICGYFGWKVGRKVYREYDPPVIKERQRRKTIRANTSRVSQKRR